MCGLAWLRLTDSWDMSPFCGNVGAGEEGHLGQIDPHACYRAREVIVDRLGNSRNMLSRGTESQSQQAGMKG